MKYVLFVCTHSELPPARSRPDRQSPESSVRECTCCTRSTTQPLSHAALEAGAQSAVIICAGYIGRGPGLIRCSSYGLSRRR